MDGVSSVETDDEGDSLGEPPTLAVMLGEAEGLMVRLGLTGDAATEPVTESEAICEAEIDPEGDSDGVNDGDADWDEETLGLTGVAVVEPVAEGEAVPDPLTLDVAVALPVAPMLLLPEDDAEALTLAEMVCIRY